MGAARCRNKTPPPDLVCISFDLARSPMPEPSTAVGASLLNVRFRPTDCHPDVFSPRDSQLCVRIGDTPEEFGAVLQIDGPDG